MEKFKRATKLYFTHYLYVVNILFNTGLYKSVYVCVCLYPSTAKASSVCNDTSVRLGHKVLEGRDQRSCVEGIILDTSAKSLHLSF